MSNKAVSILLVDDDKLVASSLARMLRSNRYEVSISPDPKHALAFCEKIKFDLVITDQRMPVMDGTEFAAAVKNLQPEAKVILVSGYSDAAKVSDALSNNVIEEYVGKPWDNRKLLELVERQLSVFSGGLSRVKVPHGLPLQYADT